MSALPSGTVTFLFTDIEGSTRLLRRLGERYADVLGRHDRLVRAACAGHGGREVNTQGDGFFVAFARAGDAVAAAVQVQRAMATERWPEGASVRVRVGVHTGEPMVGADNYVGLAVHRAARICAVGHGGQILLSSATRELLEDDLRSAVSFRDLGERRLKDFDRPVHLFAVVVDDLPDVALPVSDGVSPVGFDGGLPPPNRPVQSRADWRSSVGVHSSTDGLLERAAELEMLHASLDAVGPRAPGRLVLVAGDAGVGKTALVRRFCDDCESQARVLWGACEPLFTPRPLGPLFDVAESVGGRLEALVVGGGAPHEVIGALGAELRARLPTVFVLEDVHWADEATLDVVRLLARRLEAIAALMVVTYRDDELEPTHPLRIVLGDVATQRAVGRMRLAPLSRVAVAALAETADLDAAELYRVTGGNPFFVTEVLAASGEEIPATVRDAVMARSARLSDRARHVLEAAAIVPRETELWLLEGLAPGALECLDEILASGMFAAGQASVRFRHELARLTVEDELAPHHRLALHRRALDALAAPPGGDLDLARLAHHAEAAGDRDAVLRFAPAAAARAAEHGAHREAAAQYALALRFAAGEPQASRAELLERRSHECYLIDDSSGAIEALEGALACHREVGDDWREAVALTALAEVLWCPGRTAEAREAAERAVALLGRHAPGRELASAWAVLANRHRDADDFDAARAWALRALALAERLSDRGLSLHANITLHTIALMGGEEAAREQLEACREAAAREGLHRHAGRARLELAWAALHHRRYATADTDLTAGMDHARRHGLDLDELYLVAFRARWQLDQGEWEEALATAATVLRHTRVSRLPRILGLVVTGLIGARRGESGARDLLDEALAIAQPSGELTRLGPAAAARAELAWLEGDAAGVDRATAEALSLAAEHGEVWVAGELVVWRHRAGIRTELAADLPEPYAAELSTDWVGASAFWEREGCPYEAALSRAGADSEGALRQALAQLQALGAVRAAAIVARRLRERGWRAAAGGAPNDPAQPDRSPPARSRC
jgi:class 3 adenylate cyclase/tetratricopeptide (TPR) repeat protein